MLHRPALLCLSVFPGLLSPLLLRSVTSKDGSKLYVDGNLIVSNDGVHGPQERCGASALKTGVHLMKAVGFHGDGPVRLLLQYAGPDTGGKRAVMQSLDSSPF
jgi:hypothetical protein